MSKKKIFLTIILPFLVILFFFIAPLTIAETINSFIFNKRCDQKEPYILKVSDYKGLKCEESTFKSDRNKELHAYLYSSDTITPKGVVIYAHGFDCGGSNSTMMFADYFVKNDYYYFTYDATANGLSKGSDQNGLIQGVLDLDKAIYYVKTIDKIKNFPLMLLGHSWGGFSVCSVLAKHPDVKAVCSISGFNNANDLMINSSKKYVGDFLTNLSVPYLKLYERMEFHGNTKLSSLNGLKKSNCNCLIIHSTDDEVIDMDYGYNKYYREFRSDSRFRFIQYTDRGHGFIFLKDDARNMVYTFEEKAKKSKNKEEVIKEYFDKDLFINGLDTDLFDQILEMYNNSL